MILIVVLLIRCHWSKTFIVLCVAHLMTMSEWGLQTLKWQSYTTCINRSQDGPHALVQIDTWPIIGTVVKHTVRRITGFKDRFPFVLRFIKIPVTYQRSHSHLTDVSSTTLRWHLSNINLIQGTKQVLSQVENFPNEEIGDRSFSKPTPSIMSDSTI